MKNISCSSTRGRRLVIHFGGRGGLNGAVLKIFFNNLPKICCLGEKTLQKRFFLGEGQVPNPYKH